MAFAHLARCHDFWARSEWLTQSWRQSWFSCRDQSDLTPAKRGGAYEKANIGIFICVKYFKVSNLIYQTWKSIEISLLTKKQVIWKIL